MIHTPRHLALVVFDLAGTTVDHGCFAPIAAFLGAFADVGVAVTPDAARGPMGLKKIDHIRELTRLPEVAEQWQAAQGREFTEADVHDIYARFVPRQLAVVEEHGELIPGLLDTLAYLRERGIKTGTTTGYFGEAAEIAYRAAARQGFEPDSHVNPEHVPAGRPAPWMIYRNMEAAGVYPAAAVLKIGDTVPDVLEGRNAGVWTVGVTRTGSEVGLTAEAFAALEPSEQLAQLSAAETKLLDAGAHAVVESVADLPALIPRIEALLAQGEQPTGETHALSTAGVG